MRTIRIIFIQIMCRILRKSYIPPKTRVGKDVYIGLDVMIDPTLDGSLVTIEDEATITSRVVILTHDASSNRRINSSFRSPVRIGKRAFIGYCSIILPGVTIGNDTIIGAGSIVTKNVEDGTIVAGCPAKKIGLSKELDEERLQMMKNMICYSSSDISSNSQETQIIDQIYRDKGGFFRSP
jgi:maltose O-acetyltransferase